MPSAPELAAEQILKMGPWCQLEPCRRVVAAEVVQPRCGPTEVGGCSTGVKRPLTQVCTGVGRSQRNMNQGRAAGRKVHQPPRHASRDRDRIDRPQSVSPILDVHGNVTREQRLPPPYKVARKADTRIGAPGSEVP